MNTLSQVLASFPSLEIRTANDGGSWGTRLESRYFSSEFEFSYISTLAAGSAGFRSSGYASSKLKWLKILTQHFLTMKFTR